MDDSPAQNQPGSQPLPQDAGSLQGEATSSLPPPPLDTKPLATDGSSSTIPEPLSPVSPSPSQPPPPASDIASTTMLSEPSFSASPPVQSETPDESTAMPASPAKPEVPLDAGSPETPIGEFNQPPPVEPPASVQPPQPTQPLSFASQAPFVPEQSASAMPDPLPIDHPIPPVQPRGESPPSPSLEMPPTLAQPLATVPPPPPPPPPPSGEVTLMGQSGSDFSYGAKPPWYKSKLILSVFIILLAAGLVVGGLFILQKKGGSEVATEESIAQPTQPPQPAGLTLTIDSPKEGEVFTIEEATISGKTSPNTVVVFVSDRDQDSVESDATGVFSGKVKIARGLNEIIIVGVSASGEEKRESRNIVYDTQ